MLVKEAAAIVGGLSKPEKVTRGYGIPTVHCITGSKLRDIEGSVCEDCYAHERGRYRMKVVKNAQKARHKSLSHPQWKKAMVTLIRRLLRFRWHDSGDVQSVKHLKNMAAVAEETPETEHWVPSKEWALDGPSIIGRFLDKGGKIPPNMNVRLSMHMVDEYPTKRHTEAFPGMTWSAVTRDESKVTCPSTLNHKSCEENNCSKCWNRSVPLVVYKKH